LFSFHRDANDVKPRDLRFRRPLPETRNTILKQIVISTEAQRSGSSQEHLPTSIAGVLRLRAIKTSACDKSAKRFAQMTALLGGLKYSWLDMQKTRKDGKSPG
jgi:hypothetical protein